MKSFYNNWMLVLLLLFSFSKTNAQSSVIGNPIKIGNIEVAQYDFRKIPWVDANNSCISLGSGWRLPTIDELKILYQNRESIGNFKWDSYWSSTKGNNVIAWRLNFGDGMVYDRDNTDNTACVRAVKNIENYKGKFDDINQKIQETYTFVNEDKYVGERKNGLFDGQGTYTYANGDKYVGEWKDGLNNGQGAYTNANGDKYVGEFKGGLKNGQGTYTFVNGDKYVGEFKGGLKNGQGTYTFVNGDKYVGEWKDGLMNGQGTYTYANGDKYVGEWKDALKNGQGTYTYANGAKYVGEWKDNNQYVYNAPRNYVDDANSNSASKPKKSNTTVPSGIKKSNTTVPSGIIDGLSQQDLLNALFADDLKPSSSNSHNSSSNSNKSINSKSAKKNHEFYVIVQWQKTCGNCPFPLPAIQNGVLISQPNPRGGNYNLQPICPTCGKKPYGELSGYTNNMIGGSKTYKVLCRGN